MDDLLTSVDTIKEALKIYSGVTDLRKHEFSSKKMVFQRKDNFRRHGKQRSIEPFSQKKNNTVRIILKKLLFEKGSVDS